jgi:hypothetical protein
VEGGDFLISKMSCQWGWFLFIHVMLREINGCPKNPIPKNKVDILDTIVGFKKIEAANSGITIPAILRFPLILSNGSLGSSALPSESHPLV